MKKTVGIVEFDYHPEVLRTTFQILSVLDVNVKVYTKENIYMKAFNSLRIDENTHLFCEAELKFNKENIQKLESVFYECNVLIINTVDKYYNLFSSLNYRGLSILRIHNVNSTFQNSFSLSQIQMQKPLKTLYHIYNKLFFELPHKIKLFNKVDFFAFPTETMLAYAIKMHLIKNIDKGIVLPFVYSLNKSLGERCSNQEIFKIVVPGKVDNRRKDFAAISYVIKELVKTELVKPVEFVILGSLSGKKAINLIDRLTECCENSNVKLVYYDTFVPQKNYDFHLHTSDLIFLPLKVETSFNSLPEIFGTTKISGGVNDAIKHKKMTLLPIEYKLDENLSNMFFQYSDYKDMIDLLVSYMSYTNKANLNFTEYDILEIAKKYSNLIDLT